MTPAELGEQIDADTQALVDRIGERLARLERLLGDPVRLWWRKAAAR